MKCQLRTLNLWHWGDFALFIKLKKGNTTELIPFVGALRKTRQVESYKKTNQPPPWKKLSPEASISQHTLKWSKQVHWHTDCWARYATHICHFQKIKMGMSRRDSNLWFRWSEKSLKSKDKLHFCITKHFSVYVYQYCNLYCLYDTATHVHGSIVSNWYKNMFY